MLPTVSDGGGRYGHPMRFATWNINSMRARSERVASWLQRADVDLLAVQETKCTEEQFPRSVFEEIGYEVAH
ncbi:MAG TPA: endonuclease/exonuclease/phosphatase family protein, partial [Jiangellaceae bacterium]|nr:endonuclease/exonuclease/phosphatase family protein [Jiangellaceae bacterium]